MLSNQRSLSQTTEQSDEHDQVILVSRVTLIGLAILIGSILIYWVNFKHLAVGGPEEWSWFSTYLSGLLTPIFAFLSLIVLCRTLITQQRELKKTVSVATRTAEINKNQLIEQLRAQKHAEIAEELERIKLAIHNHQIRFFYPTQTGTFPDDRIVLPPVMSLSQIAGSWHPEKMSLYGDYLTKFHSQGDFNASFLALNQYISLLRSFLAVGGLFYRLEKEIWLLKECSSNLEPFISRLGFNTDSAVFKFMQNVSFLVQDYRLSSTSYGDEVNKLNVLENNQLGHR